MREIRFGVWLIALGITLFCVAQCLAEEGDEKGCYVTYNSMTGSFSYEPVLKVADKESASDEGEPEVWVFRVWNLEPPDKDGKTHPVNIHESRYIPMRIFKEVPAGSFRKRIRCPEKLWGD